MPGGFKPAVRFVAGDFWASRDNPVLNYLRSRPGLDTFTEPFEYVYDCPVYPDAPHMDPVPAGS